MNGNCVLEGQQKWNGSWWVSSVIKAKYSPLAEARRLAWLKSCSEYVCMLLHFQFKDYGHCWRPLTRSDSQLCVSLTIWIILLPTCLWSPQYRSYYLVPFFISYLSPRISIFPYSRLPLSALHWNSLSLLLLVNRFRWTIKPKVQIISHWKNAFHNFPRGKILASSPLVNYRRRREAELL